LMQTRCSILPSIAAKEKTRVKTILVHSAVSRGTWCNGLAVVWPWPPLSSSFTETVTTIKSGNFPIAVLHLWP
jgi:hypothetical protein